MFDRGWRMGLPLRIRMDLAGRGTAPSISVASGHANRSPSARTSKLRSQLGTLNPWGNIHWIEIAAWFTS